MKMPRAVIFDFDGVIVATERGKFVWLKRALSKRGLELSEKDFAAMTGKKTAAFLTERFGSQLGLKEIQTIKQEWTQERLRNVKKYSKPIPGAVRFINNLKHQGVRLCLATGTEKLIARKALRILNISNTFDALITGDECKLSKPNPEVYRLAIRALHIPAKQILVIEDSAAGVLAAKRAGLRCAAITTTQNRRQLARADIIVGSFDALDRMLEK